MPRKRLADLLREEAIRTLPADVDIKPGGDAEDGDAPSDLTVNAEATARRTTKLKAARVTVADAVRDRRQADLEAQIATLTTELETARRLQTQLHQQVSDLQTQLQQQLSRADTLERDLLELQMVRAELNQAKQIIQELTQIREALEQAALEHAVVETVEVVNGQVNGQMAPLDHEMAGYRGQQGTTPNDTVNGARSPQVRPITPSASTTGYSNRPIPGNPAPHLSPPPMDTVAVKPLKSSIKQLRSHSIQLGVPTRRLNNEDMGWVD